MRPHRMQKMPCTNELQAGNAPGRGGRDGVVARHVRVKNVEGLPFEDFSQSQNSDKIRCIEEREFDLRAKWAISAAGHHNFVAAFAKRLYQFKEVRFPAAELTRRTNLQDAHCGIRNRIEVQSG